MRTKILEFYKKLSLTQQILSVILIFVICFVGFFEIFVSTNIDKTIANQMYDNMAGRQETIVAIFQENSERISDRDYEEFALDTTQTNCVIYNGKTTILNIKDSQNGTDELYAFLEEKADALNANNTISEGKYEEGDEVFFYRLIYVQNDTKHFVVASFMNNTYPEKVRKSMVDSTIDVMILAYFVMFLILMIWVYSIIHPLNQIKTYIEQVRMGKDVELHINREDEIGEVADALVGMKEELKKQETAKEEMIHNISHDLKTPIATIKSYAESIKDGIYPYGTLDKSVDVIIDNAQRLEDKVHSLLYLNRVEYLLTSDAEGVVTNMKEVIEQVVLNSAVIRPEIEIITDVEEVFFDGLIEAWRVAIENIMENAFRYAQTYIKIEVHENRLKISNDGPKMPEERIETLFRPYEKGEGGRFGLGLSIVSKVVKANKYYVKGYNTEDGVCFEIYRPTKKQKKKYERRKNWKA